MTIAAAAPQTVSFAYRAEDAQGNSFSGTIDARDLAEATRQLESLQLRIVDIGPAQKPARARALGGDDFLAFNQQLAHLASAGLPVERGLRLIAREMRKRRLAQTVKQVADELDRGTPLDEAFEKHRRRFPPLYGRLVAAGVRSSNLPGMLLNMGRHHEMVHRLRAALWKTMAYPLVVLVSLMVVLGFMGYVLLPQFEDMFAGFAVALPPATVVLLAMGRVMPVLVIAMLVLLVAVPLLWQILRLTGAAPRAQDLLLLPLPLIGPVLKRNLVARWCDAVSLGVAAGLDLPESIRLAGDAVASPALSADGQKLVDAIESGQPLEGVDSLRMLPPTVPAAMGFASAHNDLLTTMHSLSEMYQQQAEIRLGLIPVVLTPLLLVLIAGLILFVVAGMLGPFVRLLQGITG
jgi:type IV pilus assembly protein PilC